MPVAILIDSILERSVCDNQLIRLHGGIAPHSTEVMSIVEEDYKFLKLSTIPVRHVNYSCYLWGRKDRDTHTGEFTLHISSNRQEGDQFVRWYRSFDDELPASTWEFPDELHQVQPAPLMQQSWIDWSTDTGFCTPFKHGLLSMARDLADADIWNALSQPDDPASIRESLDAMLKYCNQMSNAGYHAEGMEQIRNMYQSAVGYR